MKKTLLKAGPLLALAWLTITPKIQAQQVPLFSQYFNNPLIYNPAWAGLDRFASVNLTYRNQWTNIPGAPTTLLATIDLPFYEYRSGVGVNVFQDRIGLFQQNKVHFTYAYHIFELYENSSVFSFGLTGGLVTNRIDLSNIYVVNPNDPKIIDNTGNYQGVEFTFGMNYMFRDKFQIGFTMPQFLTAGLRSIDQNDNDIQMVPHFLLAARCTLKTFDEVHRIEPMLMVRRVGNGAVPMQFDVGVQYTWNNTLWFNAAYRTNYSSVAAVGLHIKRLRVGFARDFATSEIQNIAGSTNEIMLGYKFNHLKTKVFGAQKGRSNTKFRRKIEHPSSPGPTFRPNRLYMKRTPKQKPKTSSKRRGF
ncbi:MAG: type IX secretion system membrane protein PorP/SprF [Bernardetiaceae bacterium]|nr:type IX secretion system membrane protein PorP/SprF [Bernardetiaceae bacterium]